MVEAAEVDTGPDMRRTNNEIQLIADTILLDRFAAISSGLQPGKIQKSASFDIKSGAVMINNAVQELIKDNDGSVIQTIGAAIFNGSLFMKWPLLGIFNFAAKTFFNVDILDLIKKMWTMIKPQLMSKGAVTDQDLKNARDRILAQMPRQEIDEDVEVEDESESDDYFYPLRTASITKLTIKTARHNYDPGILSMLMRIFSGIGHFQRAKIIAQIAFYFIKVVALGAGLMYGAKSLREYLFGKKDNQLPPSQTTPSISGSETPETPAPANTVNTRQFLIRSPESHQFKTHKNDSTSDWSVPLVNGQVDDTLKSWMVYVYPKLQGKEYLADKSNSFHAMVRELSGEVDKTGNGYVSWVPKKFHSIPQIVDQFAQEVASIAASETK